MENSSETLNVRVLCMTNERELAAEFVKLGVDAESARLLTEEAGPIAVKAVGAPIADVLAACDILKGKCGETGDCILTGSRAEFKAAEKRMANGGTGVSRLAEAMKVALARSSIAPSLPDSADLCSAKMARMFENMRRRTLVMGILNVTPDSFSDGGHYVSAQDAIKRGIQLAAEGADIIDIGGESTRPGAEAVSVEEEMERVLPVVHGLVNSVEAPVSVDTYKAEVAEEALLAGATMINDVTGLQHNPEIASIAARHQAALIIMHMKGTPRTMQDTPHYTDLMDEVYAFLARQIQAAVEGGLPEEFIIVDPGFGFAKTVEHNLTLLRRLREFRSLGRPVLIGTSRKSTLGVIAGGAPMERQGSTAATIALAIAGGASIVRVHDIIEMSRAARMADAIATF